MLEKKDLEMIKDVVGTIVQESESKMVARIQESIQESESKMVARIQESENKMESKMKSLIHESENTVLGELDRVQINLGKRIDKVEKNLDELNQYYRITKLENDNTAILLKMINDQSKTLEYQSKTLEDQAKMIQDQAKSIDTLSKRVDTLENGKKSA